MFRLLKLKGKSPHDVFFAPSSMNMLAGQNPMKFVPRKEDGLFLNGGGLSATEYSTSLHKDSEDVDDIPSTPSAASSMTRKRKSDSSDGEVRG